MVGRDALERHGPLAGLRRGVQRGGRVYRSSPEVALEEVARPVEPQGLELAPPLSLGDEAVDVAIVVLVWRFGQ